MSFYTSSHFCVALPAGHLSIKQSISQCGGVFALHSQFVLVKIAPGFFDCVVFKCSQMGRNGQNHSVNNIPRSLACCILPSFHQVVNRATLQVTHFCLLFATTVVLLFIPSKPLLLLLETLNASLTELHRTFSWETFMLLLNKTHEVFV